MGEQLGLIYWEDDQYIATPNNSKGLRLFRDLADGNYYVKKSDGSVELFTVGIAGMMQLIGAYDASTNLFPATGGSGLAGAIQKGDTWIVSVAGTLNGVAVTAGDLVIALANAPAQVGSNWSVIENNIGYVPENTANKVSTYATINATLFPNMVATESRYPHSVYQQVASVNNVGAGEDTLYSNAIAANTLAINGASIKAQYAINLANTANAKVIKLYFGATNIFTSTHDYSAGGAFSLDLKVELMRTGADTARAVVSYGTTNIFETNITLLAGQDFTIANNMILTGEGVANSDIVAIFAKGVYVPNV